MGGEENGFIDGFKDKSSIFKALRGSELLNQLETQRWKDETFYLSAMPLSYFGWRVNVIKRNIILQRKKETTVGKGKHHPWFGSVVVDDEITFNVSSRSGILWCYGGRFCKSLSQGYEREPCRWILVKTSWEGGWVGLGFAVQSTIPSQLVLCSGLSVLLTETLVPSSLLWLSAIVPTCEERANVKLGYCLMRSWQFCKEVLKLPLTTHH